MASSRQLLARVENRNEQERARLNPMTVIGREEIMLRWSKKDAFGNRMLAICVPGDKIMTDLYEEAQEADPPMILHEGDEFEYEKLDEHGRKIRCWVVCYLDERGYARYDLDDEAKKATRQRYQAEGAEIATLKNVFGLNDSDINKLKAASRVGLMLTSVTWLANAFQMLGGGEVVRNLLIILFRGAGKFEENIFRDVLGRVGFNAPTETGRDFVSVCFGVKALLVNIDFGKPTAVPVPPAKSEETEVADPAEGEINGNGHDIDLTAGQIDEMCEEQSEHTAGLAADKAKKVRKARKAAETVGVN